MEDGYQEYLVNAKCILNKLKDHINNGVERSVVRLSPEAQSYWVRLYNEIESNLKVGGRFEHARDHGSKLAENIVRKAALLTYIELGEGEDIPLGILKDAERIAFYFSDVYLRCFAIQPEYLKDLQALSEYFQTFREDGERYIRKNKIRQSGPNRLRVKRNLDEALNAACQNGEINILTSNTGMLVVDIYPGRRVDQSQWNEFLYRNGLLRMDGSF